ncbi:MAG: hypothetical protein Q8P41_11470 [Pseudomonadota bacterium]|nr:hypothetical protein [Pseudomonadota bacterium]
MLFGCAPETGDEAEVPGAEITALAVDPDVAELHTGPDGGEALQFGVVATFADGKSGRLDAAEWTVSNRTSGTIDETGLFTPSSDNGGITWVTARFDGVEANAVVTVVYDEELVVDGAPTGGFDRRPTETTGLWLYPEDGVNFPRNTPSIQFQWNDLGASSYRLRFTAATTDLSVYTTATSWSADEATWARLVGANAGATLEVELSAIVGGEVLGEPRRTLNVNRMDGDGTIYYWSTSVSGFLRVPYGGVAEEYLTATTTGHCVGCHDISPSGAIAFTYDGGNGALGVRDMATGTDIVPYGTALLGNFKTYSPDGRYLLTTLNGALLLHDAATGTFLWEVPVDGEATQVDWSPDGDSVVVVLTPALSLDWVFTGGRIAVMEHHGDGVFGNPRVVYDPAVLGAGYNAYYPVYSPDGEWIAFNVSTGDSYDDPDANVYVISAEGGDAVPLTAANQTDGITNSWPRWGPLPDDSVMWLAFSSKRAYGTITAGAPQIWVAAFDPTRARAGEDPSWPAFWLPGQDPAQNNHIPLWAD